MAIHVDSTDFSQFSKRQHISCLAWAYANHNHHCLSKASLTSSEIKHFGHTNPKLSWLRQSIQIVFQVLRVFAAPPLSLVGPPVHAHQRNPWSFFLSLVMRRPLTSVTCRPLLMTSLRGRFQGCASWSEDSSCSWPLILKRKRGHFYIIYRNSCYKVSMIRSNILDWPLHYQLYSSQEAILDKEKFS